MGMFFGESGKSARVSGIGTYEEIEDVYSRIKCGEQHEYDEEDNYE